MRSRKELANTLRILAMDAVDAAKSGHPGAPMGMADMAESLWRVTLRHNPANPHWVNRDRFVLSNGHASMLLYGLLHLTGYDLSMDDIRHFRQLNSRTPGHPEFGHTPGVETTTGPLGQGLATAVGMAMAEKLLAAEFNREGFPVVDHFTYVFLGDGCLMEGISQEACSIAGVLNLNKLIALYDSNGISIDGKVDEWFADDTPERFHASGWHVIRDVDGHDAEAIDAALTLARTTSKPTLICCTTIIGYGSPNKSGSASCHGSPMGEAENTATRIMLGWEQAPFSIPQDIYDDWDARAKGARLEDAWNTLFAAYSDAHPALASAFLKRMSGELPADWEQLIAELLVHVDSEKPTQATRIASKKVLDYLAPRLPGLFGTSADLSGSVGTKHASATPISAKNWHGNYFSCGVREFGMAAFMNGMALHGGFIPYGGTFLVFSDYERAAIRLAALMHTKSIFVLTHDSIGVGEDGPTHQPIEHVPSLRLIPNLFVWRPCDSVETVIAWQFAIQQQDPSCLVLTRQDLPTQPRTAEQLAVIRRGGYVLAQLGGEGQPQLILLATGSEVALAMDAARLLADKGHCVRVVSMPCTELFDAQNATYRETVLPNAIRARVAIEAAAPDYWRKYVGLDGDVVGMNGFGTSAPGKVLFKHFGFTPEHVVEVAENVIQDNA